MTRDKSQDILPCSHNRLPIFDNFLSSSLIYFRELRIFDMQIIQHTSHICSIEFSTPLEWDSTILTIIYLIFL